VENLRKAQQKIGVRTESHAGEERAELRAHPECADGSGLCWHCRKRPILAQRNAKPSL